MKWFGLIVLFISALYAAPQREREWRIVIENNFLRSRKIWGTYGQISLKTTLHKKKSVSDKRGLAANMMLKNGKMVLIQPVTINSNTIYKVNQFPYKKKKGRRYQVSIKQEKGQFLDLYKEQLIAVLKKNNINLKHVDWESLEVKEMNCKSKKRNFNCQTPLIIKAKTSS